MAETPTRVRRAVQKFEEADEKLKEFMAQNADTFDEYIRLVETRNLAVEKAQEAVRSNHSSYGDFTYRTQKNILFDETALKAKLSPKQWKMVTKIVVDRGLVEGLIRKGEISKDDIDGTFNTKEIHKCHGPKAWSIT
jgi:hypothetical protein